MIRAAALVALIAFAGCRYLPPPSPKSRVEIALVLMAVLVYWGVQEIRDQVTE